MSSTRSVSSHSNSRVDASNVSVNSQPSEDRGLSRRKERTPTQNRMALPTISFMQIPPSPSHRRSIHNVGEMPSMYRLSRGSTPRRSVTPRDDSAREGEAMRVYVRVRPFSEREVAHPTTEVRSVVRIDAENQSLLSLLDPTRGYTSQSTYTFTHCFWSVFERVADGTDELTPTASMGRMSARRHSRSPGQSMTLESRVFEPELDSGLISPRYKGAGSSVVMADVAGSTNPPPLATQAEVYAKVGKPILINVLEGYNGCIFAYGPTSSGKTYTMLGYSPGTSAYRASKARSGSMPIPLKATELMSCVIDESTSMLMSDDNRLTSPSSSVPPNETSGEAQTGADEDDDCDLEGIIPRMCMDLFSSLHVKQRSDSSLSYKVEVSYYEIYNEKVFDLLAPTKGELRVRQNPTTGPYVEKVTMRTVQQQEDVAKILRKGRRELHMASTKFNDHSSRSHSILSVDVVQIYADGEDTNKTKSKLSLVDLAGSERTGAAGAEGKQFADGININLSLTVLGRVIDSLAELSQNRTSTGQVVPYRDSKLTWLLSDSLGGNSLTSMIATVSPHALSYEETKQTLRYASRARQIMNCAVRNEDPQLAYIRSLRCEVTRLQELLKNSASVQYTQSYVMGLEKRCRKLEQTCEEDQQTIAQLRADLEAASLRFASASDAGSAVPLFLPGPLHAWFDMLLDCVDAKMSLWMEGISGGSPSAKPPDRSLPIIDLHKARATPSIGTTLTSAEVTPRSEQRGAGAGFPDQLSAMTDIITRLRSTYDESVARMATELETAKTHYHHNLTDAKAAFEAELLAVRSELSGERRRRMALERAMTAEELKAVDAAEPPSGALSSRSERSDNDTAHPCPSGSSSGPGRDSGPARTGDPPLAVPPTTTCSVSDWRPPTASTGDFAASEVEHVLFDPSEADEDAFLALLAGPHGDVNPSSFLRQLYPDPEGDEDGEHQQESGCDDHLCVSSALEELCTAQDSHRQSIDALHRKVTLRLAELVCSA